MKKKKRPAETTARSPAKRQRRGQGGQVGREEFFSLFDRSGEEEGKTTVPLAITTSNGHPRLRDPGHMQYRRERQDSGALIHLIERTLNEAGKGGSSVEEARGKVRAFVSVVRQRQVNLRQCACLLAERASSLPLSILWAAHLEGACPFEWAVREGLRDGPSSAVVQEIVAAVGTSLFTDVVSFAVDFAFFFDGVSREGGETSKVSRDLFAMLLLAVSTRGSMRVKAELCRTMSLRAGHAVADPSSKMGGEGSRTFLRAQLVAALCSPVSRRDALAIVRACNLSRQTGAITSFATVNTVSGEVRAASVRALVVASRLKPRSDLPSERGGGSASWKQGAVNDLQACARNARAALRRRDAVLLRRAIVIAMGVCAADASPSDLRRAGTKRHCYGDWFRAVFSPPLCDAGGDGAGRKLGAEGRVSASSAYETFAKEVARFQALDLAPVLVATKEKEKESARASSSKGKGKKKRKEEGDDDDDDDDDANGDDDGGGGKGEEELALDMERGEREAKVVRKEPYGWLPRRWRYERELRVTGVSAGSMDVYFVSLSFPLSFLYLSISPLPL